MKKLTKEKIKLQFFSTIFFYKKDNFKYFGFLRDCFWISLWFFSISLTKYPIIAPLRGSHSLSARRAQRTLSSYLEVGPRRDAKTSSFLYDISPSACFVIVTEHQFIWSFWATLSHQNLTIIKSYQYSKQISHRW